MQGAFFDLDKTVIAKAALMAFGRPLHDAGYISRWLVMRSIYGQLVFRYFGADEATFVIGCYVEQFRKPLEFLAAAELCAAAGKAVVDTIIRPT